MLVAKAKMTDRQLEPTDNTTLIVTVHNTSPVATAVDVQAQARLAGKSLDGISLTPDDRSFGTIPPKGRANREFALQTERALPQDYKVLLNLAYNLVIEERECEQEGFTVVCD